MTDRHHFDLRVAVAEVLDGSGLTSLDEIAAKVAANVPSKDLRAALALALRPYVRELVGRRRMANPVLHPGVTRAEIERSARSPKVAAIRAQHAAWLRDLVHVEGGYKPLGECDYDDLMFAATERRELAVRNVRQAERLEQIAELLHEHDVETVADLPAHVLGGEAA